MACTTDLAQFNRAAWQSGLLIPLWTTQIALLLGLMGIFSYRLAETIEHWDAMRAAGDSPRVELVWEMTNIAFSLLALVLTILEITKTVGEVLTPFYMLASHAIKLSLAFVNLALDIVVYLQRSDKNYSIVGLAIDCGLLVATLIPSVYSALTFRRLQGYDDYVPTTGLKHASSDDFEMGNHVQIFAGGPTTRVQKGGDEQRYPGNETAYASQTGSSRSPALKIHVARAVGTEFGWGSGDPTVGRLERSGSLVGMGVVGERRQAAALKSFEAIRRDSERGLVGVEGDEDDDDDDEDDGDTVRGSRGSGREVASGRQAAGKDDTWALLASQGQGRGAE